MTNEILTETQALLNLTERSFNSVLVEAYGNKKDPASKKLLETLRMRPGKETVPNAILKVLNFYLINGRAESPAVLDKNYGLVARSYDVLVGQIRLKSDKKLIEGSPVGYSYLHIPHFLPEKWEVLAGYHQKMGNVIMIYPFADGRQIKVFVSSVGEGQRAIEHLLKAVDPSKLLGTAKRHCYKGAKAEDAKAHRLTGLDLKVNKVTVIYPNGTNHGYQL